jgi:hypothetical protein
MSRESLYRVARTFVIAFLGILIPGLLSWLHSVTEWATNGGQAPFPDATSLGFLAIAGIAAGFIALVNLIVVWLEDVTGHAALRDVPSRTPRV